MEADELLLGDISSTLVAFEVTVAVRKLVGRLVEVRTPTLIILACEQQGEEVGFDLCRRQERIVIRKVRIALCSE